MKTSRHSTKGFSLLEITFVILLISITIVSTASYIHNANEKAAAKKVAMDINYWLNAAINYYSVESKWPSKLATLANAAGERAAPSNYVFLPGSDLGTGASIRADLPNESFALMVKAFLPRALVEVNGNQASLYAYTPPVATLLPAEAQVKGVGYLHFYNCKHSGTHNKKNACRPKEPESPCIDPANSNAYKFPAKAVTYQDASQYSYKHSAGVCAMPVPTCAKGTVPQIYYALSQFRAPFGPEYAYTPGHNYQTYPYQVDIMCQAHSNNSNIGPCGPNTIKKNNLAYWAISITLRNYQFTSGVTKGINDYSRAQDTNNWNGTYYDEHSDRWSAMVSYVVACVPTSQIDNQVSGGVVRYMDQDSHCYSQDMMIDNDSNASCDNS